MPSISILILTYNSKAHIKPLIESIKSVMGLELQKGEVEIIIVDNNSSDGTAEVVRQILSANIIFYQRDKNAGYASGINYAAKKARGDLFLVVNPDAILTKADVEKIKAEFESDTNVAIAGLVMEDESGKREKNAGTFFNPFTFLLYALGLESAAGLRFSPNEKKEVDFVSGGFVVFRKDVFQRLEGYDEDFFMYIEDMDICYRARKMGYKVVFSTAAKISHKGQGSSNREFAIVNIYKGLAIFYKKHGSVIYRQYINNLLSVKAALIIFLGSILGKKELVSTYIKALRAIS